MARPIGPTGPRNLVVSTARTGDVVTVRLAGELDLATAPLARSAFLDLAETDADRVVVEMGALEFVDVVGVGVLVSAQETLTGRLVLRHPSALLRRVLTLLDLKSVLPLVPD